MEKPYTMQRSDNLTTIARRFGLNIWQDLYNSTDNAAFCAKWLNPNLILPGDIVVVPDGPLPPDPTLTEAIRDSENLYRAAPAAI